VLRHVKALRDEGLQTIAINEQLATLTFAEIDTSEQAASAVALAPTAPDAPTATPAPLLVLDDLQTLIRAIQQGNQTTQPTQRDFVVGLALGFLVACALFLLLLLLAVLYGGFR
jgi:hypothetical protein